ncbi:MAG: hypothetical protein FWD31_02555 [Planctomycetaceae bacterium]|nr:hypothetical protein [Planctomycetaceae bacterium]
MARVGFEARIKINDLPLDIIGDITVESSYSEVEVKNRLSRRVTFLRALETWMMDLTIENNNENPALQVLKTAYKTEATVKLTLIEDDDDLSPETEDVIVTKMSRSYPLEDKMALDVSLRPSAYPKTP